MPLNPELFFLLQGVTLGLTATSTPGPFQAYLLAQTTQQGMKRTLPLCFAPLVSDGPIIILVLLLLTQLPAGFLRVLQVAGGLFMLYLAWDIVVTVSHQSAFDTAPAKTQPYYQAVLMNFISPWPYIYWSTITGPLLLKAWSKSAISAVGFIGGFYSMLIGGFMVFVLVSASALQWNKKLGNMLPLAATVALAIFGGIQIWSGLMGR
jgi:threonine/homoserine/homoserine lactone efflux protein